MPYGTAKNKVRLSKNKQATQRYKATKANRLAQGKPKQAKATKYPTLTTLVNAPTLAQPINYKKRLPTRKRKGTMCKVVLCYVTRIWYMGIARYYAMPTHIQAYAYSKPNVNGTYTCLVPRTQSTATQTVNAHKSYNTTTLHNYYYITQVVTGTLL